MTSIVRIISVILGVAVIIWAFVPSVTFYRGMMGSSNKEKPLPKWSGPLWFLAIGLWIIYMGVSH